MSNRKTVLILGGCGYVGGHLATTLLNNHYEVVIYDLLVISAGSPGYIKDVVYYEGNILDKAFLLEVTSRHAPFMVIHLSSYGMSGAAMLSHACDQINVEGVKNAIDACLQNNVECLLYTSTYNTCFAGQEIVDGDETYPTAPLSAHTDCYGPSKTVAEEYIERAHFTTYTHNPSETSARRKLNTYILRPAAIYGPDEARHFPRILQHMDSGIFSLFRVVTAVRVDWVFIDNLVQAYLGMINHHCEQYTVNNATTTTATTSTAAAVTVLAEEKNPRTGQIGHSHYPHTFFISDGTPIDSWTFLQPLAEARDCPFPTVCIPLPVMLGIAFLAEQVHHLTDVRKDGGGILSSFLPHIPPFLTRAEVYKVGVTHFFSIAKAQRELGYSPTVTTEEGSRRMADRYHLKPYTGTSRTTNNTVNRVFFRVAAWYWWLACVGGMGLVLYLAYFDEAVGVDAPVTSVSDVWTAVGRIFDSRGLSGAGGLFPSLWSVCALALSFVLSHIRLLAYTIFGSRVGIQWVWILAVSTHVLEAVFCVLVADGIGVQPLLLLSWFLQTMLLGGPSLSMMINRMEKGYHHWPEE